MIPEMTQLLKSGGKDFKAPITTMLKDVKKTMLIMNKLKNLKKEIL